jgi:large subunit ribosomal protein L44e
MKFPGQVKRYCPYCKMHTVQKVIQVKGGQRGTLTAGSRRKGWQLNHGYGSTPYPMFEHAKRLGVKQTKRYDIRYKCTKCNKMTNRARGKKAKKVEIK